MQRIVFTFGTLYPDNMIEALLGKIPQNFYGTLSGYSMYKGNYSQVPSNVQKDLETKITNKDSFAYVFAKPDPVSDFIIEGRAYVIDLNQEMILDHWERYPDWYRKRAVKIKDTNGKMHEVFIYTLDIDGERLTEYKRVMNNPENALKQAKKMRELVMSKFPKAFES